jgi:hypothetical protein
LINTTSIIAINSVGFGTVGVTGGSIAAGIQAGLGAVTAGGWFATFQSIGALGVGILGSAVLPLTIGMAAIYPAYKGYRHYYPK